MEKHTDESVEMEEGIQKAVGREICPRKLPRS